MRLEGRCYKAPMDADDRHELAQLVAVIDLCCEYVARHPDRKGPEVDAALQDMRDAITKLGGILRGRISRSAL
jgi:hypothetical protein